jgi:rhodanese-related sulfurtransferase
MKKLIFTLLLTSSLFGNDYDFKTYSQKKLYKQDVTALEAFDLRAQGMRVIDVRSKKEYDFRHVPAALWIPIYFDKYGKRVFNKKFIDQVDYEFNGKKNTQIILVSKKDARAKYAANILAEKGYTNIYVIKDGFLGKTGWVRSGLQYWRRD